MILKPNATVESQLAKPGLVTCAAGGGVSYFGATARACRTRASMEVQQYLVRCTLLVSWTAASATSALSIRKRTVCEATGCWEGLRIWRLT